MAIIDYSKFLRNIPVAPHVAAKVLTLAEKKDFSYPALERLISVDPGLTAKILKIANSSQFARQHEIKDLRTAMTLVGVNTIKNLVILITGSNILPPGNERTFYNAFWNHSILTAFLARNLALQCGFRAQGEQAFVGGLLHNLGQVALFLAEPKTYTTLVIAAKAQRVRVGALEEASFGTTHKEVGHQVLKTWNFPPVYSETALEHGNPNITSEYKQIIILVSIAGFLASNLGSKNTPLTLEFLRPYLPFLGVPLSTLEELQSTSLDQLASDPLFAECRGIFSLP